jgi:DNA polymerase IV
LIRKILHLDLDAFFCSVEERVDASLGGIPFAVGGIPSGRGVVTSCSYPARRYGVRSGMAMSVAQRLCPELTIVAPHYDAYRETSQRVMSLLDDVTPLVEQISIDEAFLDVSDLPAAPEEVARSLRRQINERLDLPCSFGVATNKLVAKIANNVGKASAVGDGSPNSIHVVIPGMEATFLAPLSVEDLWGVGPKTGTRLRRMGIETIGDLAAHPTDDLRRLLGRTGMVLSLRAQGIDDRPVEGRRDVKSISEETTFVEDISELKTLMRTLRRLSEDVGFRLRHKNMVGSTVRIKLRWADFTTITRQSTLSQSTDMDRDIYAAAIHLFRVAWQPGRQVRLLGVGVDGLSRSGYQLTLWQSEEQVKARHLQAALDRLRGRYGHLAVFRGSTLEED